MKTVYRIGGYMALAEKDNWKEGCYGPHKSEIVLPRDWTIEAPTFPKLLEKLNLEFGGDREAFLLDSCEELGRLDLQVMQLNCFNTSKPTSKTMEKWKKGFIDLWLVDYIFHVEKVESEFNLEELIKPKGETLCNG